MAPPDLHVALIKPGCRILILVVDITGSMSRCPLESGSFDLNISESLFLPSSSCKTVQLDRYPTVLMLRRLLHVEVSLELVFFLILELYCSGCSQADL